MWVEATVGCGLGNYKVQTEKSLTEVQLISIVYFTSRGV